MYCVLRAMTLLAWCKKVYPDLKTTAALITVGFLWLLWDR